MLAANFSQFLDPHPAAGNQFGHTVLPLSTGNVVVTSPFDDYGGTDAGAVYLFNGATGALISALHGTTVGDRLGFSGVTALTNGNYVVRSPFWNHVAGAATWGSGTAGVKGVISGTNSLIGSTAGDGIGANVTALTNGNYVVSSTSWNNGGATDAGAVTWGSGTVGVKGVVSAANSLVGSMDDQISNNGVTALTNGSYVVISPNWTMALRPTRAR
jgi:hypothetical protein